MAETSCPDQDSLRLLLEGKLPSPQAEELQEHLLNCERCTKAARDLPVDDKFLVAMRTGRVFDGDEDVLAEAIERAKQLRSQAETVETDETILAKSTPQAADTPVEPTEQPRLDEEIDFLAPGEQPDEIGRLGDYRVLEVLGVGGMGVVFRAEDPKLERLVALKAMKPALAASRSAKDRFVREAKATAAIDHHHIVQIFQVGEDRGVPFIAMQFLRGDSLQKRLDRDGKLDQRDVARVGREIAEGLAAAHKRGLIHRDIKPDNIWLEEESGWAKILDFGLARTHDEDAGLTQTGMVLGTPKYMAPEQAKGETVDHRCDLFSLGSVLYHLASGKAPFEGGNLTATLIAVSQADCQPIEEVCPDLHADLAELITRLLSKDRDARPQSAAEVVDALAGIEKTLDEEAARLAAEEAERLKQQQVAETTVLDTSSKRKRVSPEPVTTRKPTRSRVMLVCAALALLLFITLWATGVIFKVETPDGTLVVKVTGDDFSTTVQGKTVTIKNTRTGDTFTIDLNSPEQNKPLKPGEYEFVVSTDSGLKTKTNRFEIASGKTRQVEVWWEPKQVADTSTQRKQVSPDPLAGASSLSAGGTPSNYALSFDGKDDYVEVPTLTYDGSHPATVELWCTPAGQQNSNTISIGGKVDRLAIGPNHQRWATARYASGAGGWQPSDVSITANEAVHLAAVWDGDSLKLFVNGRRQSAEGIAKEEGRGIYPATLLGAFARQVADGDAKSFFYNGQIDDVRISKVARYTEDFTPAERLEADENTLALYHFDMGWGDKLVDSSGNGHHGKIHGATWVYSHTSSQADPDPLAGASSLYPEPWARWPSDAPRPAVAPFDSQQAKQHQGNWAKYLGVDVEKEIDLGNDVKLTMVLIPPGEFLMGSTREEIARLLKENTETVADAMLPERITVQGPQHFVRITRPFYLGKYEVTQAQWQAVTGSNPSHFENKPTHPVEQISWKDVQPFIEKMNEQGVAKQIRFALPTEAEWEYACRAGTTTSWHSGDDDAGVDEHSWVKENSDGKTHSVGQRKSNSFSLFDMHGNVFELCFDKIGWNYYKRSAVDDPFVDESTTGTMLGQGYVVRGGGWSHPPSFGRSAYRGEALGPYRSNYLGFRLAATMEAFEPPAAASEDLATDPYARDREAAKWVLSAGGTVRTDPKHEFRVTVVGGVPADVQLLKGLPGLWFLNEQGADVDASLITALRDCPNLGTLIISGTPIHTSDLVGLQRHTNLCWLTLQANQIDDWTFLDRMPYLQVLQIYGGSPEWEHEILKRHPRLHTLYVASENLAPETADRLQQANPKLRLVMTNGREFRVVGMDPLSQVIRTLTSHGLVIDGPQWSTEETPVIPTGGAIIRNVILPVDKPLTDEIASLLACIGPTRNDNLAFPISASGMAEADDVVRRLVKLCRFTALNVSKSDLTDAGLSSLATLVHLESLNVTGSQVTKAGIEDFKRRVPGCVVESDFGTFEYEHRLPPGWGNEPANTSSQRKQVGDTGSQQGSSDPLAGASSLYTWPKDQPAAAIAPFDAEQAKKHQEQWAKHLGVDVEITNSIGMKFRVIPPGEFLMGTSEEEIAKLREEAEGENVPERQLERYPNSAPQHQVALTKPIALGVYEVTRGQFRQFIEATGYRTEAEKDGKGGAGFKDGKIVQAPEFLWHTDPGFEQTDEHPVVNITLTDARAFCDWLSEKEGVAYRLPTEAEWEFACRAGSNARFGFGDDHAKLRQFAWYGENSKLGTNEVGQTRANSFGLLDMHGNVWEFCQGSFAPYLSELAVDPTGVSDDPRRVLRGGGCENHWSELISAYRLEVGKKSPKFNTGFRVLRTFDKPKPAVTKTADQTAAEFVLGIGGKVTVQVEGEEEPRQVESVEGLEKFVVTGIDLTGIEACDDEALKQLDGLKHIRSLWIKDTSVTERGLLQVNQLTSLTHLALINAPVTDSGLKTLAPLNGLEDLSLAGTKVTGAGLVHIKAFTRLQRLVLDSTQVSGTGYVNLQNPHLSSLQHVGLRETRKALEALSGMQIRNLVIHGADITNKDMELLGQLPSLVSLELAATQITDDGVHAIGKACKKLRGLDMRSTQLSDEGLTHLSGAALHWLLITDTRVTAEGVEKLHQALPKCTITWDGGTIKPEPAAAEADRADDEARQE